MGKLDGKTSLITGAGRGLGKAIAIAFAGEGARIAVNYNASAAGAADAVDQIRKAGGVAEAFHGDISDPDQVTAMVKSIESKLGGVDILVNNAGIMGPSPLPKMTP